MEWKRCDIKDTAGLDENNVPRDGAVKEVSTRKEGRRRQEREGWEGEGERGGRRGRKGRVKSENGGRKRVHDPMGSPALVRPRGLLPKEAVEEVAAEEAEVEVVAGWVEKEGKVSGGLVVVVVVVMAGTAEPERLKEGKVGGAFAVVVVVVVAGMEAAATAGAKRGAEVEEVVAAGVDAVAVGNEIGVVMGVVVAGVVGFKDGIALNNDVAGVAEVVAGAGVEGVGVAGVVAGI